MFDVYAQLVAAALAEFGATRSRPLVKPTYLAISMVGATPHFYKIPITQALFNDVASGRYPTRATIIQKFMAPVPTPTVHRGMFPVENRFVYFQCLEAMRGLVVSLLLKELRSIQSHLISPT